MKNDTLQTEPALVIWTTGHKSRLLIDGEYHTLPHPGKWRINRRGRKPLAPGDRVRVRKGHDGWEVVETVPRDNEFTRRAPGYQLPTPQVVAANIDIAVIVASAAEPTTPFGLVDRLLITAELGNIQPALVVNKIDLITNVELLNWERIYQHAVETLVFSSASQNIGILEIEELITDKTILLAGSSGVGKSSIVNSIDPNLDIKVREISEATGKGKHTTSRAELHPMKSGGWITDTPGLRECGPWGKTPQNLASMFPEMRHKLGRCKFRDCLHRGEKGCAFAEIIGTNAFPQERYDSYLKLLREAIEEKYEYFDRLKDN